ncbi:MAG: flavin reductase family protein [Rhodoglobus sp.]
MNTTSKPQNTAHDHQSDLPMSHAAVVVDGLDAFKRAFRRHAAGVAVVTALMPDGTATGFTVTSLASLSAVPPLATFNMAQAASSWAAMTAGNRIAIHTLGPRSHHQAQRMAADHTARFIGDHWHPGPAGVPLLADVTAWMVGSIIEVHPVRNSAVIVVHIQEGSLGDEDEALLYHERSYFRPGTPVTTQD